ncbi:septum formation inhibitor Maf [Winogradskyella maritima]|uniref:Septum formation inhibitor Maf n=1 Tax=Winogradskyella maritima TaxID=1517766 RepID=A0ABV8ADY5_9FLAO|nr:septum formation inhibitor Maf [Winogradskyella maritima]
MKTNIVLKSILASLMVIALFSCETKEKGTKTSKDIAQSESVKAELPPAKALHSDFKSYWYAGEAEITSYKLEQARYGELRDGEAVLIYVTEDFLPNVQVKADNYDKANIPILKLNATKNFVTGIYPYRIMQSTFFPVANNQHAIKAVASMQEWCGQVYAQLNNRDDFEIVSHSYFQGEADQNLSLTKTYLENEVWTQLRLDPKTLPTGDFEMIPALEYIRMKHVDFKAFKANAVLSEGNYTITYPNLNRSLSIDFNPEFPYEVEGWSETYKEGYGDNAKEMTTKATKLKLIKSAYWGKNGTEDEGLRQTLGLK